MPSPFQTAWSSRQAVQFETFGQRFALSPRTAPLLPSGRPDVNAECVPDATRPEVAFAGVYAPRGALIHALGRAMADRTTSAIQAESPMIKVAPGEFAHPPVRGDRIIRQETGEAFAVTRFEVVNFALAWIHLIEAERPPGGAS